MDASGIYVWQESDYTVISAPISLQNFIDQYIVVYVMLCY